MSKEMTNCKRDKSSFYRNVLYQTEIAHWMITQRFLVSKFCFFHGQELLTCTVLFMHRTEKKNLQQWLNAICQKDTVELRLVGGRMLRFNNQRKFKTFKGERGELEMGKLADTYWAAAALAQLLLLLLLRLSSSTRTQWDSSLQRTYGGRLADATNSNFERRDSFLENFCYTLCYYRG